MDDPNDPATWTWDTPEHVDWPEGTGYPPPEGLHHDHELAEGEP